ncbi:MAG: hypothetical protein Q8M76_10985 [Spirochaetaceae bacterium]|nr:hypothetical protein [Spirochaetaceae bacterium]
MSPSQTDCPEQPEAITLKFSIEPHGKSHEVVVHRLVAHDECRSIFPILNKSERKGRFEKKRPIVDWRCLLTLRHRTIRGTKVNYGLPLLVLLAAHRDRADQEEAWVDVSRLHALFPHPVTPTRHAQISKKLRDHFPRERHPDDPDLLVENPDHLIVVEKGESKGQEDSTPAKCGLKKHVRVAFAPLVGNDAELSAEEFAVTWLIAAVEKVPKLLPLLKGTRLESARPRGEQPVPTPSTPALGVEPAVVKVETTEASHPTAKGLQTPSAPPTKDVAARARRGKPPAISAVPGFFGRMAELDVLQDFCAAKSGANTFVVTGMAGTGKTALVREFVAKAGRRLFGDDIEWVSGGTLTAELPRIAARYGWNAGASASPRECSAWLASALHDRRLLLVIDDLTKDAVDLGLVPAFSGLPRLIVTTQSRRLSSYLLSARVCGVGSWDRYQNRAYFEDALRTTLQDEELDALVDPFGRVPVAMRLLALAMHGRNDSTAHLQEHLETDPLGKLDVFAGGEFRAVGETFGRAYGRLDVWGKRMLVATAACAPSPTEEYILAAAGLDCHSEADHLATIEAREALATLADLNLLRDEASLGERRWKLESLVRLYGRSLPEAQGSMERHKSFVLSRISRTDDLAFIEEYFGYRSEERGHPALPDKEIDEALAAASFAVAQTEGGDAFDLLEAVGYRMIEFGREEELADALWPLKDLNIDDVRQAGLYAMLGACLMEIDAVGPTSRTASPPTMSPGRQEMKEMFENQRVDQPLTVARVAHSTTGKAAGTPEPAWTEADDGCAGAIGFLRKAAEHYRSLRLPLNHCIARLRLGLCYLQWKEEGGPWDNGARLDRAKALVVGACEELVEHGAARLALEALTRLMFVLDDEARLDDSGDVNDLLTAARERHSSAMRSRDDAWIDYRPERLFGLGCYEDALLVAQRNADALRRAGSREEWGVQCLVRGWMQVEVERFHEASLSFHEAMDALGPLQGGRAIYWVYACLAHEDISLMRSAESAQGPLSDHPWTLPFALGRLERMSGDSDADRLTAIAVQVQDAIKRYFERTTDSDGRSGWPAWLQGMIEKHRQLPEPDARFTEIGALCDFPRLRQSSVFGPPSIRSLLVDRKPTPRSLRICEPRVEPPSTNPQSDSGELCSTQNDET